MSNNLHISYDLKSPGQNYDKVIEKIKSLGDWAKVHYSFWYVNSSYSATEARDIIISALDQNDELYVVDSTGNQAAWTNNVNGQVTSFIKDHWFS